MERLPFLMRQKRLEIIKKNDRMSNRYIALGKMQPNIRKEKKNEYIGSRIFFSSSTCR